MLKLLFSFSGRARRMTWWLGRLGVIVGGFALLAVVLIPLETLYPGTGNPSDPEMSEPGSTIWIVSFSVIFILMVWAEMAIAVRRWHDRGKSGWMYLILLIPIVGPLWTLIECGFVDGEPGPNEYGPSPKGIGGDAEDHSEVFS